MELNYWKVKVRLPNSHIDNSLPDFLPEVGIIPSKVDKY